MVIAKVVLINRPEEDEIDDHILGEFEFLHLPRIGESVRLPGITQQALGYRFDGFKVQNVINRPREYPRTANSLAPSQDDMEPQIVIWICAT
jgi:hypothetical protein